MGGGAVGVPVPRNASRVHRLPAVPASARLARRSVAAALAEWGCAHLGGTAQLLVSELVTNAVVHAGTDIELRITFDGRLVHVEVHDGSTERPIQRSADFDEAMGRGIGLVDALAWAWGSAATTGGKLVWFDLDSTP